MHIPLRASLDELVTELPPGRLTQVVAKPLDPPPGDDGYLRWDRLIHLAPPEGFSHREWWLRLKFSRLADRRVVPLGDLCGEPFSFSLPDPVLALLYQVDQQASGRIGMADSVINPANRDRYVVTSLIEEAITSSQLEGASTTRRVREGDDAHW
jgi:hypothetical protein